MNQVEEHLSTSDFVAGGDAIEREEARANNEPTASADRPQSLFPDDRAQELRSRWDRIQTGFVDEPRKAVEQADELVATAMKHLAESFANERARLEGQWDRGDQVNTEDLRQALRRYRAFFQRLLAV